MPKLPVLTPKQLFKKLGKLGFVKDHQTGSHIILYNPIILQFQPIKLEL